MTRNAIERDQESEKKAREILGNVRIAFWAHILFVIFSISHRHTSNIQSQFILKKKYPCIALFKRKFYRKCPQIQSTFHFLVEKKGELWRTKHIWFRLLSNATPEQI